MTQKGTLSPEDEQELLDAKQIYDSAQEMLAEYRAVVIYMLDKSSYREVARLTGLSTNTLQRWKREASK
jgi:DNA-directed RNA polymerase specialized sigma24 family protein